MCYFITATLPANAQIEKLQPIFHQFGLSFSFCDNPFIIKQLPPLFHYFRATKKHCDCGTALGSGRRMQAQTATHFDQEKEIEKLQNKGWGEHKIHAWILQKEQHYEKKMSKLKSSQEQNQESAQDWLRFLQTILNSQETSSIGLLLHFYKTNPETEKFSIQTSHPISLTDVDTNWLTFFQDDTLYQIQAGTN